MPSPRNDSIKDMKAPLEEVRAQLLLLSNSLPAAVQLRCPCIKCRLMSWSFVHRNSRMAFKIVTLKVADCCRNESLIPLEIPFRLPGYLSHDRH
jgi:hypothetical protein